MSEKKNQRWDTRVWWYNGVISLQQWLKEVDAAACELFHCVVDSGRRSSAAVNIVAQANRCWTFPSTRTVSIINELNIMFCLKWRGFLFINHCCTVREGNVRWKNVALVLGGSRSLICFALSVHIPLRYREVSQEQVVEPFFWVGRGYRCRGAAGNVFPVCCITVQQVLPWALQLFVYHRITGTGVRAACVCTFALRMLSMFRCRGKCVRNPRHVQ